MCWKEVRGGVVPPLVASGGTRLTHRSSATDEQQLHKERLRVLPHYLFFLPFVKSGPSDIHGSSAPSYLTAEATGLENNSLLSLSVTAGR